MKKFPNTPPPPYFAPPSNWYPHQHAYSHPQPSHAPPAQYYYHGTVMMPVPLNNPTQHPPPAEAPSQPTYINNYICHGETANKPQPSTTIHVVNVSENPGSFYWVPSTASAAEHLTGRAVLGSNDGYDTSPVWVIRTWHGGDLIPGRLSVKQKTAFVTHNGKDISVTDIEVLCAKPENVRWIAASHGNVPPGAIPGGRTSTGETLYVGRANHRVPLMGYRKIIGKVHPSHHNCYIGYRSAEVPYSTYEVLCQNN